MAEINGMKAARNTGKRVAWLKMSLVLCLLGLLAHGYVWFGYNPASSAWLMTPTTIMLDTPQQTSQVQVLEYMPDICTTSDITQACTFWTDNPEWRMTSGGLLSCRVSGEGVCYARVPTGTVISNTISVDPHLPPRILQLPVLPATPAPVSNIYVVDLGWNRLLYVLGHGSYFGSDVEDFAGLSWEQRVQLILDKRTAQLTALGLQGLVNRRQPRIYVKDNVAAADLRPAASSLDAGPSGQAACSPARCAAETSGVSRSHVLSERAARAENKESSEHVAWHTNFAWLSDDVLPYLTSRYDYTFVTTDLFWLIQRYSTEPQIKGFLIYPQVLHMDGQRGDLINYITSYCGVHGTIPISQNLYTGLTNEYPACSNVVLNMTDDWIVNNGLTNSAAIYARMLDELAPHCSRRAVMKLHPHIWQYNRDFAIAHKLFCFNYSTAYTGREFHLMPMTAAETTTFARLDALLSNQYVHGAVLGEWECNIIPWIESYYAAYDTIVSSTGGMRELLYIGGVTTNLFRELPGPQRFAPICEPILDATEAITARSYYFLTNGPPIIDSTRGYHWAEAETFNIARFSSFGQSVQYTFYGQNLSLHAGVPAPLPWQRTSVAAPAYDASKIYVCFYVEGNDGVSYKDPCSFDGWFGQTNAGMGLPLNALNVELAPALMRHYVETAPPTVEFGYGGPGNIEYQARDGQRRYGTYRAAANQLFGLACEFAALGLPYAHSCAYRFGNPYMNNQERGAAALSAVSTNWPLIMPGWLSIAGAETARNLDPDTGQYLPFGWKPGYGNIHAGRQWCTNSVPVSLPMQTLTMDKSAGAGGTNLQVYFAFANGVNAQGQKVINDFCKGTLDWSVTNRPQFWQINLPCIYIYADPTQEKMYENAFHRNVWLDKLGNATWLERHPVVQVTPSQFGALMREHQCTSQ